MGTETKKFLISFAGMTLAVYVGMQLSHWTSHLTHAYLGKASAAHSQPAASAAAASTTTPTA